jgi:hypothetical protein
MGREGREGSVCVCGAFLPQPAAFALRPRLSAWPLAAGRETPQSASCPCAGTRAGDSGSLCGRKRRGTTMGLLMLRPLLISPLSLSLSLSLSLHTSKGYTHTQPPPSDSFQLDSTQREEHHRQRREEREERGERRERNNEAHSTVSPAAVVLLSASRDFTVEPSPFPRRCACGCAFRRRQQAQGQRQGRGRGRGGREAAFVLFVLLLLASAATAHATVPTPAITTDCAQRWKRRWVGGAK